MEEKYRLTIDEGTEDAFVKEYTREELESKKDYIRDTYAGRYKVDRVGDADLNNIDDAGNYTLRIGDFSKSYTGSELKGKMDYINQTYGGQYTIESSYGSYNDMDSLFNDIPSARERLEAFNAEHGAFMDDFEARDTAETKMARAGMSSGLVVPAEGSITGEERQRYNDLYKQEEALKKAWYNSPEYLESQGQTAVHLAQMRNEIDRGRLTFAQNNPVIEGYNPSATRGAEADVELQLFETASRIIDDTIKLHNAPSRYDGANAWQNVKKFAKGTGDTLSDVDFWTSGLTEIADNLGVRNVLQKVQKELGNLNNLDEATIEGMLSPAEKAVLQAWAINAQEQLNRSGDLSRGYQAGQGATESLGFMAEFALTGGVGKAASEGVETMAKWLGRKVLGQMDDAAAATVREMGEKIAKSTVGKYGARLADALAETAGKTLVMPSTFRNISEKAAEIQEDAEGNRYLTRMNDAFAKGFTDSFIENLSEGGRVNAIGDLIGDVAGKIPAYKKIVDKFANSKAGELLTAFNSSGIMNTLRAGGWHGFGEEYLEEWYGNALRTITGLDKDALKDFATVDNQLITITSFLPMTIFGGTVSTAQVLSAKKGLDKKAEMLRSALLERGYDEKQADNMIDMMRGASPAEISQTLTPIVNAVALRDLNEAAALMKPVGEFAEAVRRWQSFDTKYQYQEQEQRDNLRTQMTDTLGQFWQEDENGRQTVQRGVNANGEVVYLLGKPTAEEAQSGMPQQVAAITSEGRKVFVDPSAVRLEKELEMNDFLGTEIMAEKGNKEQARMIEEKERALAQVRQMSAPGTTVNLGTTEAPIVGTVAQRTPDGVVITMEDGSARQVSYEELGNYVGVNTTPLTDAQMDERDADALSADRAQREAELDMEYENLGSSEDELIEAEAEVEQAVEAATPLPTKADGSVDQTALWNEDPARWAAWNDEQRQDGGMNSLAYINGAIANESAKIAEMQAGYDAITDFDERDALEQEVAAVRERLQTLVDLRDKYSVQAEVAAQAQQANAVAQMTEEEKAQAEEQRREPLRKKAQEWSSRLGVKVNIAESLSDVKEEQAREQILRIDVSGSKERATGWFNPTTGEVTIYLPHTTDSSEIEKTIVHEVVAHKGLRGLLGQEGFNVLCDSVWEMMSAEERQKYLAYPGVNGNRRAAADEYIAHYAETMNLEESKPVWDRIMDLIVRILNSMGVRLDMSREQLSDIIVASYQKLVKEAENSVSSQHGQKENNISAEERGYSAVSETGDRRGDQEQNVGDSGAISEGLLGLPGNGSDVRSSGGTDGRGEAGIGKIGERDRSGEISEQQISAPYSGEPTEITSNDGEVIADTNGNGSVRFSIRTWREGGRDYLAAWLANDTVLTDEEKADILARMDEFYENAQKYTDTYVPFGTWSEAAVRYDNNGNPLMSVIKANGDYSMNLDFSLVCKKRRPLNRLLRTLINRNAFGTYSLREREIAEINWILQEHGFEVACALCFVDSKRYRVTGVADVFAALYNKLVEALAPKGATIAHFNYNGNPNVEAVEDGIDTLPDDQLNWNKFEKLAKKFKPTSVEGKVAQLLRENPAQRKLVDATDFIEAEGFEAVKANNQELLKLYNAKKGTGGPKASFGDVQYLNDILKKEKSFDVDKAYSVGGVRIQSFSDFVPHMYFDYMQLFAELAAKKLPAHAYTKEVLFAKIFGLTGLKINLSLVPAVVEGGIAPGLDAEGNYAWADAVRDAEGNIIQQAQSFPFDEAMAIQNAEGYSKNCGAIAVGISDEHIDKMLDDPNIQFIIPYHKSSLNAIVARMTNIDQYKDYTNVQNTRKGNGTKLDKGTKDFNFNEYLHGLGESGTPQQAAQAYLDWCRENGFKPKFSQFAYHPNYYKLLVDFNTIDTTTGEYTPQGSVTMTFPTEESAFGNVETLIQQGLQEDVQLEDKLESEIEEIADEVEARLADIAKEPQLSEKEQMKRMAQLADERAAQIQDRAAQAIDLETEAKKAVAADIAFRFIGEQAAQRVDQMTNSNVMMDNLQTAKDMESQLSPKWSQKKNPAARKIKMATGWERGVDGLWRYEMPDFEYKAKPDGQKKFTLSELIEDKTLFVEYPQMADIPVEFKDLPDGVQGITTRTEDGYQIEMSNTVYRNTNPAVADALNRFMADHPEVFLRIAKKTATREDVQLFDSYFNGIDAYADEMGGRNVLAHEIQHVIQYMEGFAVGGGADMFDTHDPQAAALAKRYEQESNEAKRLSKEYGDIQRKIGLARFAGHTSLLNTLINDAARIQQEYNMRLANCRDIVKVLRGYGVIGQQGYDNLAGEVEAKNVEARLDKTPEQRRESLIADTQEVEHRFQTILRDNLMTDYAESRISFRITPEQDKAYMDAVEAGDMETAQMMVNEAAKIAMPNTKVVDENGNPKVVYHGGSSTFTKFDTSLGDGMTDLGQGSYFSSNEEIARIYTVPNGDNQWQIDNYIEEHPYLREMSRTQLGLAEAERIAIREVFKNAKVYPVFLNMENPYYTTMEDFADGEFAHLYNRDGLRGYDGIIDDTFKDRFEDFANGSVQYVAFKPSQIKSADPVTYDDQGNVIPLSQRFNPENEDIRFRVRSEEQREKLFEDAKEQYGVTDNFNIAGYMLPDGSLLNFADKEGEPNIRGIDHRNIGSIINDREYESRWDYITDFLNEGAIRLMPESDAINLSVKPSEQQREKLLDYFYKKNGYIILELADQNGNSVSYMEYDRGTSPYRIFRDIDGYFNDGIVPQQDVRFRMSNENQAIFVSNAAKAVEGIKQEKATPEQWLKMIEKAGGLKAGEDKWMGLSDWLKASDKKTLTKAEVLDFINENMIVIEEQHYNDMSLEDREHAVFENLNQNKGEEFSRRLIGEAFIYEEGARGPYLSVNDPIEAISLYHEETGEEITLDEDGLLAEEDYNKLVNWAEEIINEASEVKGAKMIEDIRKSYTTRGLTNLHEIALTVPTIEPWEEHDFTHFGDAGDGRAIAWIRFGETEVPTGEYATLLNEVNRLKEVGRELYEEFGGRSNELAEVEERRNELEFEMRNYENPGKKILVIDEIQSKRHQEGREKGYVSAFENAYIIAKREVDSFENYLESKYGEAYREALEIIRQKRDFSKLEDLLTEEEYTKRMDLHHEVYLAQETEQINLSSAVPDAPFDKNWHELAMKRMLRYAAENGYDVIAWTKGEQQAERYDIGGVVESIYYAGSFKDGVKDIDINLDTRRGGNIHLQVDNNGEVINEYNDFGDVENSQYIGKNLSEILGKELANKVLLLEEEQSLSGEGLRVGGEGMNGFYDKMLPAFMNKYGKKWGVKVEDIDLPNLGKSGYTMHSVPVTEEMKASVMEGQVMFRTTEITPEVRDEMDVISATALINGNYMKAPNGADTNLTAEQWAMVRTKNFKKWFGDWENDPENASKVVDENGEPKVVYHGTGADFTKFVAWESDRGYYHWEIAHFGTREQAEDVMRTAPGNKHIMEVFLNIRKPYRISDQGGGDEWRYAAKQAANGMFADQNGEKADGLIYLNEYEGKIPADSYAVWNPSQIKSATDNTGEFSEEEGDIRYRINSDSEAGIESLVERTFRTSGAFSFSGKEKIESRDDVAFIFKQLEDSAIENSFLVFVKDGIPTIIHVGMGDISSTMIDNSVVLPAYKDFGADKIYMVHNHPSGSLYASKADLETLDTITKQIPDVPVEGIIINTVSGEYASFDLTNSNQSLIPDDGGAVPIKVLSFDKNVFAPDYKSKINERKIKDSSDVASFLSAHRLGEGSKVGALLLNRQNMIYGNLVTNDNEVSVENADTLASQIAEAANRTGSSAVILFGDFDYSDRALRSLSKGIKKASGNTISLLDVVRLEGNHTLSLADDTLPSRSTLSDGIRFRVTGTPTDEVVAKGLDLTPAQTAELAGNIFAALPEESRKKITEGLSNVFDLKDAIMQIPTSLAMKEEWNDEDRQMAEIVASEVTKMAGEMTRPFSASEGLWVLYNALNPISEYDILSQASRAIVQRNLGFDAATLEVENEAKEDVRFRTVGNASINATASLYNQGAADVFTRLKESFVDMNASVEELVDAIEKRTGQRAKGFENVLLALNQQSSKGLQKMESYEMNFLNPMMDEIRRIMNKTDFKYEDIARYVILKHGLERNDKMAKRDAREYWNNFFEKVSSMMKGKTHAELVVALSVAKQKVQDIETDLANATKAKKQRLEEQLVEAKTNVEVVELALRGDEKSNEQDLKAKMDAIDAGTEAKYLELRNKDYSGITSMFYNQLNVNRKDFNTEEEYQAAVMEAKQDKYKTLADVEAAAQSEVDNFENLVSTADLWKKINAATKETLRQQYEANMISKDQYESLRDMYEFYVPLRGFADNTAEDMYTYYRRPNSTGYTKPILAAEGRKTEAESPFGWIASMAGSAIASNVKNEAKLALYYFVSNRSNNGVATISRSWFVHVPGDVDADGKKIYRPAYPPFFEDLSSDAAKQNFEDWQERMRDLQKQGLAYESGQRLNLGNSVVNISDANKPEHIVTVKVGGKDYTIIINGNPRAAQAINGDLNIEATAQDYSALFGPILRWMSSVNTSYNPEFWITNMMRDMAFTWMAVNTKEDAAYRRRFADNYRKAFSAISLSGKNEKGELGNSYIEQMYKEFVEYGGVTGYTQIKDNETWEKEIENYLSSNDPERIKNGKIMRGVKDFFHGAHRFGESLEQISRFAAFLTSREMGKSMADAINDAKEITVNFNRKGSGKMITLEEAKYLTYKGKPLSKPAQWAAVAASAISPLGRRFIMFFNAAIQGLNATYKLYKKNPSRFVGWTLAYASLGAMNAVIHAMLDDDDDYLDIPQYERRTSLMIGWNGVYAKWAMPQEARAFYALGDLAVESIMGRNPHQNVAEEAGKILTEILPINPAEGWKAFLPSVAVPAVELMLNKDYKGDPIYNDQKWLTAEERKRSAKWSSAYQGTGGLYVGIAQGLNYLTGGDKYDAGLVNLQPEKMEYLVQSAFGGTIRTADKFISSIVAAIDPEEDVTVRQLPFLNRILTINDERFRNVHVNDVYEHYEAEAQHALTLEKKYKKDNNNKALRELRESEEYQYAKIYSKYKKSVSKIQEKIKAATGTKERMELMQQQDELKRRMIKEISELP